jgi:hypothetical protein
VDRRRADRSIRRHGLRPVLLHRAHAHAGPVPAGLDATHSASVHAGRADRRVLLAVPVPQHIPGEHAGLHGRSPAGEYPFFPGHVQVAEHTTLVPVDRDLSVDQYVPINQRVTVDIDFIACSTEHGAIDRLIIVRAPIHDGQHVRLHTAITVRVAGLACPHSKRR